MSNTKTEAQRLADQLTRWANDYATTDDTDSMARQAAAELLRLESEHKKMQDSIRVSWQALGEVKAERDQLRAQLDPLQRSQYDISCQAGSNTGDTPQPSEPGATHEPRKP